MRPITPQPGYTEADVVAALVSGQFIYADCITFIPKTGPKLRYTTAQKMVTVVPIGEVGRQSYTTEVLVEGLKTKNTLGTDVDEQEVTLTYPDSPVYQASMTWAQALLKGRLDGALVVRDRYIALSWDSPWLGGMPMFMGLVSTLNGVGDMSATMNVKSNLILLNRQAPAYLWEASCKNTWGDSGCGVDQGAWSVLAAIGASPTRSVIPWSGATDDYNSGKIHIVGGDSVTRVRTIARVAGGDLYLAFPLDYDPTAGDSFIAFPGCTRTNDATHGCPKYWGSAWPSHFAGVPFIPVAETAV